MQNDFSQGPVHRNILRLALPMTFAQLVNVLYSIVDRVYIGHIPGASSTALTGVGLTFPILLIITAFANLFGTGGAPLFSIARGAQNHRYAARVMGNTCCLLAAFGLLLTAGLLIFKRPLLYLFGASDATFPYANSYLTVYLTGSVFVMFSLGMNGFINAQGFGRRGMATVLIGAVINLLLDPLFIFVFRMGVAGAALATVLSQFASALWAVGFLRGRRSLIRLSLRAMRPDPAIIGKILSLGMAGFIMAITTSLVQVVCNATLQHYGGDIFVGVMTVLTSVREVVSAPVGGLVNGAQPVMSFNYGAKKYARVQSGIRFLSWACILYTTAAWLLMFLFPEVFIAPFTADSALIAAGRSAMHIYFFGFFMMSLQMAGQAVAVALGRSGQAVFFSLLRKAFIVVPLTLLLPHLWGLGANGVFWAEPVSNFVGGAACFITMMLTIWPSLKQAAQQQAAQAQGDAPPAADPGEGPAHS